MTGDKHKKNESGFTIVELVVATAVFVFVVTSVSGIFVTVLQSQRRSIAYQQLLDQTSYLMEYMSRSLRMAKKDLNGACTGAAKLNYSFSNQCLKFRNYKDQCQQFCLDIKRIKNESGDYLTSDNLSVLSFDVILSGQTQNDNNQPKAVISLDIQGKENAKIKIQTVISQRNLDVKR